MIVAILVMMQGVMLLASFGVSVNMSMIVPIIIGSLFIFMGNLMPKIQPTYFVGIRTPWTLASDLVWRKTHQLAGKLWVIFGFLMLLLILISNAVVQLSVMLGLIIVMVGVPIIYSYIIYEKN